MAKVNTNKLNPGQKKMVEAIAKEQGALAMAGSKGMYNMKPGHSSSKPMSEINMSNKDALMMSALLHKADPPGHVHGSTEVPTVTVEKSSSSTNVNEKSSSSSSGGGSGVSYEDAYKNVDKTKYPTLESFTTAAKEYKKNQPTKVANMLNGSPSGESTSASKTFSIGNKSESDILNEQKSVTNTNTSMIGAIDLKAKNQRISDSIAGRNKYVNKLDFQDFKDANTPGTTEFYKANQVGSAYGVAGQSNSGYSSFTKALETAVDSDGKKLFPNPSSYIKTVYRTDDKPITKQPFANTSDYDIAERVSKSLGSSYNVQEEMNKIRKEQSDLKMKPLKMSYGMKNNK